LTMRLPCTMHTAIDVYERISIKYDLPVNHITADLAR
jgi:hypothetical protein